MRAVKDSLAAPRVRGFGGDYFYAEVFRDGQFESSASRSAVGYLMDFEVHLPPSKGARFLFCAARIVCSRINSWTQSE